MRRLILCILAVAAAILGLVCTIPAFGFVTKDVSLRPDDRAHITCRGVAHLKLSRTNSHDWTARCKSDTRFGAYPGWDSRTNRTESWESRLERVSKIFGGRLRVVRVYEGSRIRYPDVVNNANGYASVANVSYSVAPNKVANGSYDAQIINTAKAAPTDRPTYFVLDHEPDQSGRPYTAAQFVAGFRRFYRLMHSVGNPMIKVGPIYMNWSLHANPNWPITSGFWPGNEYADFIGIDAYFSPTYAPYSHARTMFANALRFAAAHKPLLVGELSLLPGFTDAQWKSLTQEAVHVLKGHALAVSWFYTWKAESWAQADGDWRMSQWNDTNTNNVVHRDAINVWKAAIANR